MNTKTSSIFAGNFLGLGALAIVVAGALFVISLVLSGKILAVVSTVLGCFILFNLAMLESLHPLAATVMVVVLGTLGLTVQTLE